MQPKVNKEVCIGCGACVSLCGAVFKLGEDGKSEVIEGISYEESNECIKQSIESCPVQAISVEE